MYVNIVRGGHSRVIECRATTLDRDPKKPNMSMLGVERLDGYTEIHELQVNPDKDLGVYLMNDTGQTITTLWRRSVSE